MPNVQLPTALDMYYEVRGGGEPVVFIPATGFSGEVWKPFQVAELSKSMQVIIFDQRGTGRSSTPKGVYTIDQMAGDTVALLDHLNIERAHILGHSMGGRIGLSMALNWPGRVKSLILAASGSGVAAFPGPACVPGLPEQLIHLLIEHGLDEYVRHEVFETHPYFTDSFRRENPQRVQELWDVAWPTHARLHAYVELCRARHTWDGTYRLGDVKARTLAVVGIHDTIGRSHVPQAEILAQRIPGARYLALEDQSHGFFWQAPEETNRWIREWVQEHR